MQINFGLLTAPFPETEWDWRVQQAKITNGKPWVLVVPYVDARAVQYRLDEVVGAENWGARYRHDNGGVFCTLSLRINDEWVSKEDGSDPTETEAFKGAISKAFVRTASAWGIGRHFYEQTPQFAEIVPEKTPNAKYVKIDGQAFYWVPPGSKPQIQQSQSSDPKDFVVTFGKKFPGKRLAEIPSDELRSYCEFLKSSSERDGKPLSGKAQEFIQAVDDYLGGDLPF